MGLVVAYGLAPISDGDTFLHLATGRWIVEHQAVPHTDVFSHTAHGLAWTSHEWLAAVGLYGLWALGGLRAVALSKAVMAGATMVLARAALPVKSALWRVTGLMLVAVSMRNVVLERPHMFTVGALALLGLGRQRWESGLSSVWLWSLPLLFTLWVNIHGGYVLGALVLVAWGVDALRRGRVRTVIAPFVVAALACALNPHGTDIYLFPFRLGTGSFRILVDEWGPLTWAKSGPMILTLTALVLVALWWRVPVSAGEGILMVAGLHLTLSASRFAFLIGLWWTGPMVREAQRRGAGSTVAPIFQRASADKGFGRPLAVLAAILAVASPWNADHWVDATFPRATIEAMAKSPPVGRLFHDYAFGGYLLWSLPGRPVFIDGRIDMYEVHGLLAPYLRLIDGDGNRLDGLSERGIGEVLVKPSSSLVPLLRTDPRWSLEREDTVASWWVRVPHGVRPGEESAAPARRGPR